MRKARLAAGASAFVVLAATAVTAQSVVYELAGSPAFDGFGSSFDTTGDLDGDGVLDLLVGAPLNSDTTSDAGMAATYSGRSGLRLWRIFGAEPGDLLGASVAGVDDIDHDGVQDLLIGIPGGTSLAPNSGLAIIYSGATGQTARYIGWYSHDEGFGTHAWNVGDVDDDGVTDYAISAKITLDTFGDGLGWVECYSGATGLFTHALDHLDSWQPFNMAPAGDANGDGKQDFLSAHFAASSFGSPVRAQLAAGADGTVLDSSPTASGSTVTGVGPAGDFDGDGLNDYVLAWCPSSSSQVIQLRSLPHGPLFTLQNPLVGSPHPLGMATAFDGTADIDHDGVRDLLIGFPSADVGHPDAGLVRIYSGTSGDVVAEIHGQRSFEAFGGSVRVLGDTNGDDFPEFAVSASGDGDRSFGPAEVRVLTLGPVPWSHTGAPLAGLAGVPTLEGSGPLLPGTQLTIGLSNGLPDAPIFLVTGFSRLRAPFKGGVLGPAPDLVLGPIHSGGDPAPLLHAEWPALIPAGAQLWFQAWIADPGGPAGFSATDTLVATTPP